MKKFDLEAAKNGAPVIARNGEKVRILCFDRKNNYYPIIALTNSDNGEEFDSFAIDGGFYSADRISHKDLVMAPVKKTGWINIYHTMTSGRTISGMTIYETKEMAMANTQVEAVACTQIEWEE